MVTKSNSKENVLSTIISGNESGYQIGNIAGSHTIFGFCYDSLNLLNSVKHISENSFVIALQKT